MKNIVKAQRTWYGGGGSGSGPTPPSGCCYELITVAALQALAASSTMVQGTLYQVTDVTADWQVVILAESTSDVSFQGQGIYQNNLYTEAWYNLYTNQLLRIYDPTYQNDIEGETNILGFTWNTPLWFDNRISGGSSVTFTGASITNFYSNTFTDGCLVDLTNLTCTDFFGNNISGSPTTLQAPSAIITEFGNNNITLQSSVLLDDCNISGFTNNNISASFIFGQASTVVGLFSANDFTQSGLLDMQGAYINFFSDNQLKDVGSITISDSTIDGLIKNIVQNNSSINAIANALLGNVTFNENTLITKGTINVSETSEFGDGNKFSFERNYLTNYGTLSFTNAQVYLDPSGVSYNRIEDNGEITIENTGIYVVRYNCVRGNSYIYIYNLQVTAEQFTLERNDLSDNSYIDIQNNSVSANSGIYRNTLAHNSSISSVDTSSMNVIADCHLETYSYIFWEDSTSVNAEYQTLITQSFIEIYQSVGAGLFENKLTNGTLYIENCSFDNVLAIRNNEISLSGNVELYSSDFNGYIDSNVVSNSNIYIDQVVFQGNLSDNTLLSNSSFDFETSTFLDITYNSLEGNSGMTFINVAPYPDYDFTTANQNVLKQGSNISFTDSEISTVEDNTLFDFGLISGLATTSVNELISNIVADGSTLDLQLLSCNQISNNEIYRTSTVQLRGLMPPIDRNTFDNFFINFGQNSTTLVGKPTFSENHFVNGTWSLGGNDITFLGIYQNIVNNGSIEFNADILVNTFTQNIIQNGSINQGAGGSVNNFNSISNNTLTQGGLLSLETITTTSSSIDNNYVCTSILNLDGCEFGAVTNNVLNTSVFNINNCVIEQADNNSLSEDSIYEINGGEYGVITQNVISGASYFNIVDSTINYINGNNLYQSNPNVNRIAAAVPAQTTFYIENSTINGVDRNYLSGGSYMNITNSTITSTFRMNKVTEESYMTFDNLVCSQNVSDNVISQQGFLQGNNLTCVNLDLNTGNVCQYFFNNTTCAGNIRGNQNSLGLQFTQGTSNTIRTLINNFEGNFSLRAFIVVGGTCAATGAGCTYDIVKANYVEGAVNTLPTSAFNLDFFGSSAGQIYLNYLTSAGTLTMRDSAATLGNFQANFISGASYIQLNTSSLTTEMSYNVIENFAKIIGDGVTINNFLRNRISSVNTDSSPFTMVLDGANLGDFYENNISQSFLDLTDLTNSSFIRNNIILSDISLTHGDDIPSIFGNELLHGTINSTNTTTVLTGIIQNQITQGSNLSITGDNVGIIQNNRLTDNSVVNINDPLHVTSFTNNTIEQSQVNLDTGFVIDANNIDNNYFYNSAFIIQPAGSILLGVTNNTLNYSYVDVDGSSLIQSDFTNNTLNQALLTLVGSNLQGLFNNNTFNQSAITLDNCITGDIGLNNMSDTVLSFTSGSNTTQFNGNQAMGSVSISVADTTGGSCLRTNFIDSIIVLDQNYSLNDCHLENLNAQIGTSHVKEMAIANTQSSMSVVIDFSSIYGVGNLILPVTLAEYIGVIKLTNVPAGIQNVNAISNLTTYWPTTFYYDSGTGTVRWNDGVAIKLNNGTGANINMTLRPDFAIFQNYYAQASVYEVNHATY